MKNFATQCATFAAMAALTSSTMAAAQPLHHEAVVRQALVDASEGKCSASVLAPIVRGQCLQQMPAMGQAIAAHGEIRSVEYLGDETMPSGVSVEVYKVNFKTGSMVWTASSAPDGKLKVLWSPGG